MRIVILGTELCAVDRHGGGLEQVLRRWADALASRHEVVVVSHGRPQPDAADRFTTLAVGAPGGLTEVLGGLVPDVISLHNRPGWVAHCPPGAAVAVTFHNFASAWMVDDDDLAGVRRASAPAGLSAVSRALASAAAARLGRPAGTVTVTPPSIAPEFLAPGAWCPEPTVLSPNRLLAKKGVHELLEVADRPEFADVTFAFADLISPWLEPTAEHLGLRAAVVAHPNGVLFRPTSDPTELARRYRSSAVVVCPVAEPEGLGLVALEAQACGVPLVTTDLGGLAEATFPPNRCVPPGDGEALAVAVGAALDEALDWPRRRAGVGGAGPAPARPTRSGPRNAVASVYAPGPSGAVFEEWLLTVAARGR